MLTNKLYIKQCLCCNKKYFGWTQKEDVESYRGSGVKWRRHVGRSQGSINSKSVKTVAIHEYESVEKCKAVAQRFSRIKKLGVSEEWFNVVSELGAPGASLPGKKNPMADSARFGSLNPMYNKNHSEMTKALIGGKAKINSKGERNGRYDPTIYTLRNKITGEVITGTKLDLKENYGLPRSNLVKHIRGELSHVKNYQLIEN